MSRREGEKRDIDKMSWALGEESDGESKERESERGLNRDYPSMV